MVKKIVRLKAKNNSKNKDSDETRLNIILFSLKFFLIYFIAHVLILLPDLSAVNELVAGVVASFFLLETKGAFIIVNNSLFEVTNSCLGLVSAGILAAAIFSLKKPELKKKLALFALGAVILFLINIPRLMLVIYSGLIGFDAELVHEMTWFIMSFFVLAIWFIGLKKMTGIRSFRELI